MRFFFQLLILGLAALGAFMLLREFSRPFEWLKGFGAEDRTQTTHTLVLEEVTALGKLELVRYNFKDIVEHEVVKQWMPNSRAVLIVQGEAIGCVDLSKIKPTDIQTRNDTLVLHLPAPELCVFKIDHQRSRIYDTNFAFMEEATLVQEAYRQAEKQIVKSALEQGILEQTEENARKMLVPLLSKVADGKPVYLTFPMKAPQLQLR